VFTGFSQESYQLVTAPGMTGKNLADLLDPGDFPGTAARLVFVHADKAGNAIRVTTNIGPLAPLIQLFFAGIQIFLLFELFPAMV
jgi:hypothetical protein